MQIDAITLATIGSEWRSLLVAGRIDTIIQPTEYSLAIQCYVPSGQGGGQNRWLYLSAHPQFARAHLIAQKPARIASEPPSFVMLLRKHLEGSRIETIVQPRWERVLEIVAGYRSETEDGERVRFRLIVEIMGRMSNIILCNEQGTILGSIKRVGADVNRYRVISAGVPYVPPPIQQRTILGQTVSRLEPTTITAAQFSIAAAAERAHKEEGSSPKGGKRAQEAPKLWQLLTHHVLGCSPLLAREVVYRTTEEAEVPLSVANEDLWEELAWNMRELTSLYDTQRWQPQLVERENVSDNSSVNTTPSTPLAFAPYVLEQYTQTAGVHVRPFSLLNTLLDDYFARTEWRDALEQLRAPLRKVLQNQRDRCKRKADLLQQEMASAQEAALYRLQAELLLAHQQEVRQGISSVELENFFYTSEEEVPEKITVPLDPRLDAVGNANKLFHKYHKMRRASALVPAQIEQNTVELATVEQLLTDLVLAETPAELTLVKAEVQSAGYLRGKQIPEKKAKGKKGGKPLKGKVVPPGGGVPLQMKSQEGFVILIGKNSRQNEEVTFHQASANDLWLHARGVPGAHVIIKAAGRDIPPSTIDHAAALAAYYSQARGSTRVPVDYTLQRHVRHMKGGGPGMVIYEREHTLYVEPKG